MKSRFAAIIMAVAMAIIVLQYITSPTVETIPNETDKIAHELTGEILEAIYSDEVAMQECIQKGGTMKWLQSFFPTCVIPYSDGNQPCTNSKQCEGGCIVTSYDALDSKEGICKIDNDFSGCWAHVEDDFIRCLNDDIATMCTRGSTEQACAQLERP